MFNWACCLTATWIFCHHCITYTAEYRSILLYVLSQVQFGMDQHTAACSTSWQDFCWKCIWNQILAWCQPLCLHALRHSPRLSSRGYETVCYDHNAADIGVNVEIFHCAPVFFFLTLRLKHADVNYEVTTWFFIYFLVEKKNNTMWSHNLWF